MWRFALGDYKRAAAEKDSSTEYLMRASTNLMFLMLLSTTVLVNTTLFEILALYKENCYNYSLI